MAHEVIMPALGMAQETGVILRWLKAPGEMVQAGEPLLEIETDKATVEIEAPASGRLAEVLAEEGAEVPVGQVIARILAPGEAAAAPSPAPAQAPPSPPTAPAPERPAVQASPVAARIAAEHGIDLRQVKPEGGRVEKQDVLAYLEARRRADRDGGRPARVLASPKARRLAAELGVDLASLKGSGPEGAVLAADVLAASTSAGAQAAEAVGVSHIWRVMAERVTQAWTQVPHFYLVREVDASRLVTWRDRVQPRLPVKLTYTDLLVKVVAAALREHPQVNVSWRDGGLVRHEEVNVGLAVATETGLVVPVIHRADTLSLEAIAGRRQEVVERAQAGRLRPEDLQGGTFTLSNLGMYGVDAFNPIVNPPQAAILAVGRLAERVMAVEGRPEVRPTMILTLSCDHRAVDGARAAQFLEVLASMLEEPLALLQ